MLDVSRHSPNFSMVSATAPSSQSSQDRGQSNKRSRRVPEPQSRNSLADFDRFVRPLYDELVNFVRRQCGDAARAEDVVQDAMVRAIRAWDRFDFDVLNRNDGLDVELSDVDAESAVRSWMFLIVRNTFFNEHRAHRRRGLLGKELLSVIDSSCDNPLGGIAMRPLSPVDLAELSPCDEVMDAVKRLDPHLRVTVEMCYLQGRDVTAVARELGVARQTILSRLSRARAVMKKVLEKLGYGAQGEECDEGEE